MGFRAGSWAGMPLVISALVISARGISALVISALVISLTGCAMCQAPFDYCAPVVGPTGCVNCDFNARSGSAFAPMDDDAPITPLAPTKAPYHGDVYRTSDADDFDAAGDIAADEFKADAFEAQEMADADGGPADPDAMADMAGFSNAGDDRQGFRPRERTAAAVQGSLKR